MTDGELHIEHESLTKAGEELGKVVSHMDDALARLRTQLAQQGSPWGSDELGGQFGQRYTALVEQAFTALASYRGQVNYAATRLPRAAQRIRDTEAANRAMFNQLTDPLVTMWRVPEE